MVESNKKTMSWDKLLSSKRLGQSAGLPSSADKRSPFDKDIQRIIFSGAFRRLSKKTQVHPLAANDHVHTRLTHSLEVAQVGKSLGKALAFRIKDDLPDGISPDDLGSIVEAACLAHDIGNPPFGHGGEEAMTHWFETNGPRLFRSLGRAYKRDLMFFEGNAQGFRMITQTENHLFQGGLRLTYATLGAFLKYPWSSRIPGKKFGAFLTEESILKEVASELGMICLEEGAPNWARHPLAYLVEAADDICYAILDLEDAVELRIISYDAVRSLLFDVLSPEDQAELENFLVPGYESFRVNLARIRGKIFDQVISGAVDGFMNVYEEIMSGSYRKGLSLFDAIEDGDNRKKVIGTAKKMARESIFGDLKKIENELGSYSVFETLLNAFCSAAIDQAQYLNSPRHEVSIGWKSSLILKMLGEHYPNELNPPPGHEWSEYQCLRRVIDYISGMTDNYAVYVAEQLHGAGFSGRQRP
ncbi:deoxyguanosinetriphosphate triphosphohydrolase [Allochromatium humboldtianum]|uniref:Deoxyguanosinetriphosphate triphosphohydrolase n=1 Tax=Allochromatium humboldtianum TaxID=504901 RepID=A0A850RFR5_9GAMM|nr:deoxyguanosinetriphosphate triphosphohydrolase [Allochromatium humboldtianum]NVZ09780.1 deoxyguanosinetriphosphate triphosphohydrolase [Allochromatium humboldtianum]